MTPVPLCAIRGAAGPLPDMVPVLHLPGCVPTKGCRFSSAAPVGPVRRLCPWVLLSLQGQLAPRTGLPGEQHAHYLLPTRRKQVLLFTSFSLISSITHICVSCSVAISSSLSSLFFYYLYSRCHVETLSGPICRCNSWKYSFSQSCRSNPHVMPSWLTWRSGALVNTEQG